MPPLLAWVLGFTLRASCRSEVADGLRPCPEFLAFHDRVPSTALIDYGDTKAWNPHLWRLLQPLGLTQWLSGQVVFSRPERFSAVIASAETVGVPLAVHPFNKGLSTPVNIITHGFINREPRVLTSLRGHDNVRYLCLSNAIRSLMIEHHGLPPSQVFTGGYSVDTNFFAPSINDGPPLVVSAGIANRDFSILARAIEGISAHVEVAADSEWAGLSLASMPSIVPSNMTIKSYKNYVALRDLYSRASFVVVPLCCVPYAAGYTVIAEAMAMGKAVIATRTPCPPDYLIDGKSGYYVDPGNPQDLHEKICYLLNNPLKANELGANARQLMLREHSHAKYSDRIMKLILQ